jgi:hypothetical protein
MSLKRESITKMKGETSLQERNSMRETGEIETTPITSDAIVPSASNVKFRNDTGREKEEIGTGIWKETIDPIPVETLLLNGEGEMSTKEEEGKEITAWTKTDLTMTADTLPIESRSGQASCDNTADTETDLHLHLPSEILSLKQLHHSSVEDYAHNEDSSQQEFEGEGAIVEQAKARHRDASHEEVRVCFRIDPVSLLPLGLQRHHEVGQGGQPQQAGRQRAG